MRFEFRCLKCSSSCKNTPTLLVINMIKTVGELITELKKYDPNKTVVMDIDWDTAEIASTYECDKGIVLSLSGE